MSTILRRAAVVVLFVCVLVPTLVAQAADSPTAEEVIAKYLEAAGGKEAIAKVKNRKATGMLLLKGMGVEADITSYTAPPNAWTEIFLGPFGAVERGMSDGVAWEVHPSEGPRILTGDDFADMKRQSSLSLLSEWEKFFSSVEYAGEESIDSVAYHKLVFTPEDGGKVEQYYNTESGLLFLSRSAQNGKPTESRLSDYKAVDGVQIPHKIEARGGPYEIELTLDTIEHNVEIPADRFALPAQIKELQSATATP